MCDCMTTMDAKLAQHNSRLQVSFSFSRGDGGSATTPYIGTEKINPRNRNKCGVVASFCPFCGEKYGAPALSTPPVQALMAGV